MNVSNDFNVMVFKNEWGKYSVQIQKKNQDGSVEKAYIPIQFNKGVELENKTLIKIKTAWLSFYKVENKTTFLIRCSEFNKIEENKGNPFEEFGKKLEQDFATGKEVRIEEFDLPF